MNITSATDLLQLASKKHVSKLMTFVQYHNPESRAILEEIYSPDQKSVDSMMNIPSQNMNIKKAVNVYLEKLWKMDCNDNNCPDHEHENLLEFKNEFLESIISIFENPSKPSRCLLFPSSKDGRIQIGENKQHPDVMFCRIFRWPGILKSAIRSKQCCRMHPENVKCITRDDSENKVCVNPYHYESISKQKSMLWDDYDEVKAFKDKSMWVPLAQMPIDWIKLRYYEFDQLLITKSIRLIDFPREEPTCERQNLIIDSSMKRSVDCSKKARFSLNKIDSFIGVTISKRIRESLEKGISIIRNAKSHEVLLELNSPGVSVYVTSFWLDFEYYKQSLPKDQKVTAYQNIGKFGPIKKYVHKFKYPKEAVFEDSENQRYPQNGHCHGQNGHGQNGHGHTKHGQNGHANSGNTGYGQNTYSNTTSNHKNYGNVNSDKMQHEYVIFDMRDFSDMLNTNFDTRYVLQNDSMSDGDIEDEYHHEDQSIDVDQMQSDSRISISFMKGFGEDVVYWKKDRNQFIGQSCQREEPYLRENIENTPCWVSLDMKEIARLCHRRCEIFKNDLKKEKGPEKNIFIENVSN